jgi:hypothetical protein
MMGAHSAPRAENSARFTTTKKIAASGALVSVAAAITGGGVFAGWTSSGTQAQSLTTATVSSSFTDSGTNRFETAVSGIVAGDHVYRYADVANTGDVAQAFVLGVAGSTGDLTAANDGLQVEIRSCSVAWVADACSGEEASVRDLAYITDGGVQSSAFSLAAGGTNRLRVKFVMPATADQPAFQGKSDTITVTETGSVTAGDRSAG